MRDALSIESVATAVGLSKRSAERRASRESWSFETRSVRGGKQRIYHLANLPEDVRIALARATKPETTKVRELVETGSLDLDQRGNRQLSDEECAVRWKAFEQRNDVHKEEAYKRSRVLQSVVQFQKEGHALMEARKLAVAQWTANGVDLSLSTVIRWAELVRGVPRHHWAAFLLPQYAGGRKQADIAPAVWQYILGDHLTLSAPAINATYRRAAAFAKSQGPAHSQR